MCEPFQLVWQEEDTAIIQKPRFVHSEEGQGKSVVDLLRFNDRWSGYRLVNRLDFETSGGLILAQSESSFTLWRQRFKDKSVEKTYLAIVEGHLGGQEENVRLYLGSRYRRSKKVSCARDPQERFQFSESHIESIAFCSQRNISLLKISTVYGLRHQVRVHCAQVVGPLYGDTLYGSTFEGGFYLHAWMISWGATTVTVPLPSDFRNMMKAQGLEGALKEVS